jgi:general secretion pathway protein F
VAGGLLRELETGRFCRTLGTLVKSGLALPAAVVMAASAVDNTAMAAALAGVASGLREGRTLVDRLIATKQLPAEACGLLKVGEESGRLADMLLRQAELSDANARTAISRLLGLMVPAITLGLGAVVAFIVTTLLVAILSVNNLATG